jgi:hypothetical protein
MNYSKLLMIYKEFLMKHSELLMNQNFNLIPITFDLIHEYLKINRLQVKMGKMQKGPPLLMILFCGPDGPAHKLTFYSFSIRYIFSRVFSRARLRKTITLTI